MLRTFPGLKDLHVNQTWKSSTDLSIRKLYKALNISGCEFPEMSNQAFQFQTCECVSNLPEPQKKDNKVTYEALYHLQLQHMHMFPVVL